MMDRKSSPALKYFFSVDLKFWLVEFDKWWSIVSRCQLFRVSFHEFRTLKICNAHTKKWIASDNLLFGKRILKYRPNISKLQVQRYMKCLLMSHSSNVLWHNFFGLWIAWFALPKNVNRFSDQHNFPLKYQVQFHCYQIGLFAFKKLAFYDNLYIISVWNDKNLVVRWRDFVTLICHSALSQTIMNWAAIFGAQVLGDYE